MRKICYFILLVFGLIGCQDNLYIPDGISETLENANVCEVGMQRVIVSSPDEIISLISQFGDEYSGITRSVNATYSNNEELFVSLVEANRQEVMSSLTAEQLAEIENDKEGLEFCPSDSVIADIQFAMLLNADREIQVGSVVYKYYANGVAYTNVLHASELKDFDLPASAIQVTPSNQGLPIQVTPNITFVPVQYQRITFNNTTPSLDAQGLGGGMGNTSSSGGSTSSSTSSGGNSNNNPMILANGIVIPGQNIREVYTSSDGNSDSDGNWIHRTWTGIWGQNIVACNEFRSGRKLTLNFYDQNYIVYSNIGTKLKMQKRKSVHTQPQIRFFFKYLS